MELRSNASLHLVDRTVAQIQELFVAFRVEAISDHGFPSWGSLLKTMLALSRAKVTFSEHKRL
jgi:hypothetical protein